MLDLVTRLAVPLTGFVLGCSLGVALRFMVIPPRPRRAPPPHPPRASVPRRIRVVLAPQIVRYDVTSRVGEALAYDRSFRALAAELHMKPAELRASIGSEWQDLGYVWTRLGEAGARRDLSDN